MHYPCLFYVSKQRLIYVGLSDDSKQRPMIPSAALASVSQASRASLPITPPRYQVQEQVRVQVQIKVRV